MALAFFALKNSRGQVSIEFIFLLLFIIIYITAVVMPMVNFSNNSAEEISRLGNAKIAAQKIAGTIDSVGLSPNSAKSTISVFLPEKSAITCESGSIDYSAEMLNTWNPNDPASCPAGATNCCATTINPVTLQETLECRGRIAVQATDFSCSTNPNGAFLGGGTERSLANVSISKTAGAISVGIVP
ncbi:MAG TPA: hypothetical protein VI977_04305 [archaeon]|nr:hypothetical protein [archaeon]